MPNSIREGPYRFFFYSSDREELMHVHVKRDRNVAKFWLDPVRLAQSGGFRPTELRDIERLVRTYEGRLMEDWNGYFSD